MNTINVMNYKLFHEIFGIMEHSSFLMIVILYYTIFKKNNAITIIKIYYK